MTVRTPYGFKTGVLLCEVCTDQCIRIINTVNGQVFTVTATPKGRKTYSSVDSWTLEQVANYMSVTGATQ